MSVSREACLALGCVIIANLVVFLAFDSQNPSQAFLQFGTIALWFTLSKISVLRPIYKKLSKLWYNLRIYLRIVLIAVGVYFMFKNQLIRTLLSGYFSFKGISYFGRHRIRVRVVSETVEEVSGKNNGAVRTKR